MLGDSPHLHAVSNDDVLVAQLTAQLVLQYDRRQRRGNGRTSDIRHGDMGSHNKLTTPLYAGTEGHHLAVLHLIPRLQRLSIASVRVGSCVTMTRKMLDAARDARILQTLQIVRHHGGGHGRIFAEGACANDDILRIGVHVGHWGKVYVKVIFLQIGTNGFAAAIGNHRVASGANGSHRLVLLNVKVGIVGYACHASSFFVDAEQRLSLQRAYLRDDSCQLRLVLNVPGIEDDAAHGILLVGLSHLRGNLLILKRCQVIESGPFNRWVKRLYADIEHLTHFFAKRHLLQLFFHLVHGRFNSRLVVRAGCK